MGKFSQAFKSLLTNPKWETIELVANAIGISTQELLFGIKPEEQRPAEDKMGAAHVGGSEGKGVVDELPFENPGQGAGDRSALGTLCPAKNASGLQGHSPEAQAEKQGALVCPHCGMPFVVVVKG